MGETNKNCEMIVQTAGLIIRGDACVIFEVTELELREMEVKELITKRIMNKAMRRIRTRPENGWS